MIDIDDVDAAVSAAVNDMFSAILRINFKYGRKNVMDERSFARNSSAGMFRYSSSIRPKSRSVGLRDITLSF